MIFPLTRKVKPQFKRFYLSFKFFVYLKGRRFFACSLSGVKLPSFTYVGVPMIYHAREE